MTKTKTQTMTQGQWIKLPDFVPGFLPMKAKVSKLKYDDSLSKQYAQRCKLKRCFNNCFNLMVNSEDESDPLRCAFYCEGFTGNSHVWIHHGWLELDGKIVDPTRPLWVSDPSQTIKYKPVVRLTFMETMRAAEHFPILLWAYFTTGAEGR